MTILVALHKPGQGTWIGCDGRVTMGNFIIHDEIDKWLVGKHWTIGLAGSERAYRLIEHSGLVEETCKTAWDICRAISALLDADGFEKENDNDNGAPKYPLELLLATKFKVWQSSGDLTPIPIPAGQLAAVGSGCNWAEGAAYALYSGSPDMLGERMVRASLEAAIRFDKNSGGVPWVHQL